MKDQFKTKKQLIEELHVLRRRLALLKESEPGADPETEDKASTGDFTERLPAEEKLRWSEGKFRTHFQNLPVPAYIWQHVNGDFVLIDYNDAAIEITGTRVARVLGSHATAMYSDMPEVIEEMRRCVGQQTTVQREMRYRFRSTGEVRDLDVSYVFVPPDLVVVHTGDVTEQKRTLEALRQSEERFRVALKNSPIVVFNQDEALRYTWIYNPAAPFTERAVIGKTDAELLPATDAERLTAIKRRVLETGAGARQEVPLTIQATLRHYDLTVERLRDEHGKISGVTCAATDITETKQAEEALRASEAAKRAILDAIPDMIFTISGDGTYLDFLPSTDNAPFVHPSEFLGRKIADILPADVSEECMQAIMCAIESGEVQTCEYRLVEGGRERQFETRIAAIGPDEVLALVRDITERKRVEERLRQSEARLSEAQRIAHLGNWDWNITTNQVWWSDEIYRIFGLRPQEFAATYEAFLDTVHPEDRAKVETAVDRARYQNKPYNIDHRIVLPDGTERTVHEQGEVTFDDHGVAVRMAGIVQDITEQKQTERRLRLLESVIVNTNDSVIVTTGEFLNDPEPIIVYVNEAFTRMTGYSIDDAVGQSPRFLQGPMTDPAARDRIRHGLSAGKPVREELVNYRKDGSLFWVDMDIVPVTDPDGRVVQWISVQRDITARKQAELEKQANLALFSALIENMQAGVLVETDQRRIFAVNTKLCEIFSILAGKEALLGTDCVAGAAQSASLAADPDLFPRRIEEIVKEREVVLNEEIPFADGRLFERDYVPIYSFTNTFVGHMWQYRDVTERKRAEERLRESEEKYRTLFEESRDAVYITTQDGKIIDLNQAGLELLGFDYEEINQQDAEVLYADPEDRDRFRQVIDTCGSVRDYEVKLKKKDGTPIDCLLTSTVRRARDGTILGYQGIIRDVTESKRLQREIMGISVRERRRIGDVLHDKLGQHLTGIAFLAKRLADHLTRQSHPQAADAATVEKLVNNGIVLTRKVARGLHPVALEGGGLRSALEQLARDTEDLFNVRCETHIDDTAVPRDETMATNLYFIAQEAVTNAVRHGQPQHIVIELISERDVVTLVVADDGIGFAAGPEETGGMGLHMMRYRASLMGASLTIGPGSEGGTVVRCTHPHNGRFI